MDSRNLRDSIEFIFADLPDQIQTRRDDFRPEFDLADQRVQRDTLSDADISATMESQRAAADDLNIVISDLPETRRAQSDDLVFASKFLEAQARQSQTLGPMELHMPDAKVGTDRLASLRLTNLETNGDTWVGQSDPDTNRGNNSTMWARSADGIGNGEEISYVKFPLIFEGAQAASDLNIQMMVSHNLLTGQSFSYEVRMVAQSPFDETTVTWNNGPILGNLLDAGSVSVAAGSGNTITITVIQSTINAYFTAGRTHIFVILKAGTNQTSTRPRFQFITKENVVTVYPPRCSITAELTL